MTDRGDKGFCSYSSQDRPRVKALVALLRAEIETFLDCEDLRPGDAWQERLAEAIRRAQRFYLFWSADAQRSEWVEREYEMALEQAKLRGDERFLVPVLLDDTPLPPAIAERYHAVAIYDRSGEDLPWKLYCRAAEAQYRELAETYSPLSVRSDLRVTPWMPRIASSRTSRREVEASSESDVTHLLVDVALDSHRVVVLGEPGSGKSTGLFVATQRLAKRYADGEKKTRIPLLLELSKYRAVVGRKPKAVLVEMLAEEVMATVQRASTEDTTRALERALHRGGFLVMLDGLNEVSSQDRANCLAGVLDFCSAFPGVDVAITSRKYLYNGELPFATVEVVELRVDAIRDFVGRYLKSDARAASDFVNALDGVQRSFAQNPLALRMMIDVYLEQGALPKSRARIIEAFVTKAIDDRALQHVRTERPMVDRQATYEAMSDLALYMKENQLKVESSRAKNAIRPASGHSTVTFETLLETGLLVREGNYVRYWHQNIQEYFCVRRIAEEWKRASRGDAVAASALNKYFSQPYWWETLAMAAGLLDEGELQRFLRRAQRVDSYLLAMSLRQAGILEGAIVDQLCTRAARWSRVVRVLSPFLTWRSVVILSSAVILIDGLTFAFGQGVELFHVIHGSLPLPGLPMARSSTIVNFACCIVIGAALRRVADAVTFGPFQTGLRSLQHISSASTNEVLSRIYQACARARRVDINYRTVVGRITLAPAHTADELLEGLTTGNHRTYYAEAFGSVGSIQDVHRLYPLLEVEEDDTVVAAALRGLRSLSRREPALKATAELHEFARAVAGRRSLPVEVRRMAHDLAGLDNLAPEPNWGDRVRSLRAFGPEILAVGAIFVAGVVLVGSDPRHLGNRLYWLLEDWSTQSVSEPLRPLLAVLYVAPLVYVLSRLDRIGQWLVQSFLDRRWGEGAGLPKGPPAIKDKQGLLDSNPIVHGAQETVWVGPARLGAIDYVRMWAWYESFEIVDETESLVIERAAGIARVRISIRLQGDGIVRVVGAAHVWPSREPVPLRGALATQLKQVVLLLAPEFVSDSPGGTGVAVPRNA